MAFASGPINIAQGNSAVFTVEFFDAAGFTSIPSSASMTITYTNTSNSLQVDTVNLIHNNSFFYFTGGWSSISAAPGLATYTAIANSSVTPVANGQLRIIQRKGSS